MKALITQIEDESNDRVPSLARESLLLLVGQIRDPHVRVGEIEKRIHAWHRSNEASQRLETIPGIGPIIASAIAADRHGTHAIRLRPAIISLARPRASSVFERR